MGLAKPDVDPLTRLIPVPVQGDHSYDFVEVVGRLEARFKGIHPYCISIDHEAQAYLPRTSGAPLYGRITA